MRTAQHLLFFLLVWCQTTASLNDTLVNFGENVTLDCPIDKRDIYWVFQKPTDSPVVILRSFTTDFASSFFYNDRLKEKFSLEKYSRLCISNLTFNELGIYYCVKTGNSLQLSNGTRLYTIESAQEQNQTEYNNHEQPQCEKTPEIHNILNVTSLLLNIVLIIAILGMVMLKLKMPRKSRQQTLNVETVPLEDLNAAQYSEIGLSTYSREENPIQINGTYVLLQKPNSNPGSTQVEVNTSCSLHSC
ncbi:hypothetical protein Q8A67_005780 [Cirrhinus molitorella]|uniref:Immunoglobulin domain-containing protein n=1 Tax=Cirrhinus molitorella TaxID=172907 RepID=A0AA88Q526_9TELE|nr:hypothetical protein Q8A67_005780 [Cirrhinus molitorella]